MMEIPKRQQSPGSARRVARPGGLPAVCGLLVLAVALVFGKTVLYGYVNYDDNELVRDNAMVTRGISAEGVVWAFTTSKLNMWYPLTWISYMVDSQVFGPKPWGYHLTNVLLHAATTVVLFLALWGMTGKLWPSAVVALLFAVHPLRAEAVAWIGERKSTLSGLFFVSTVAAYVAYVRHPFSLVRYLTVAALFTMGLLAKPTLVTLPFVLLLLDYWPLRRLRGAGGMPAGESPIERQGGEIADNGPIPMSVSWLVIEKIPLVLLSGACAVAAVLSQAGNVQSLHGVPVAARIANTLTSYAVYLGQFFWPARLAAFYPRPENLPAWQVGTALLIVAAISLAALMACRKQPAILVGWLWFLGMLVPMVGLVPIGSHARADRYTYLPYIGLCIAVVWGVRWGLEQFFADGPARRWISSAGCVIVVAALMACAWRQTSYWQDSERLWTHALACTPSNVVADTNLGLAMTELGRTDEAIPHFRSALYEMPDCDVAHNGLAVALAVRGRTDEAIDHYRLALAITPDYAEAHNNLGAALAGRGRTDEAIPHFQKALAIKPDYAEARYNLGRALAGLGRTDEAIGHYRQALAIKPDYPEAHLNLGNALIGRGQIDEAVSHYRQALAIKPDYPQAHFDLGTALLGCGQAEEAILHYRKALAIKPDDVGSLNNLAWLRATHPDPKIRNGAEAVRLARRAAQLAPGDANTLGTLAAACAETGQFAEAVQTARQAVDLARRQANPALAASIQTKISLYEAGKPYHESPAKTTK